MTQSFLFRSISDEIRRFWLARPPRLRSVASTREFASQLWQLGLHAGSSFERHHAQVARVVLPMQETQPADAALFD